jgi:hypothetical protein
MTEQITDGVFVVGGNGVHAVVQIVGNRYDASFGQKNRTSNIARIGKFKWVPWGVYDNQPNVMHKLMVDSPSKLPLIKSRRDFLIGSGLSVEKKKIVSGKTELEEQTDQRVLDWLEEIEINEYLMNAGLQLSYSANIFANISIADIGKKKQRVTGLTSMDCFNTRIRSLNTNETAVSAFLFNPNFGIKPAESDTEEVLIFNKNKLIEESIMHVKEHVPGQPFYAIADWWGTASWTEVSNLIPVFHKSGLANGYNIKYLIKIPSNYFEVEGLDKKAQEKLKKDTFDKMAETLSGVENNEKVLKTLYNIDYQTGKAMPGVEIVPIPNNMNDDAYTSLFNTANIAQSSGHRVLPVLAGIDTGSKLGGSGKELEVAANFQQNFLTAVDRQLLLKPLNTAAKIMGFNDTVFSIKNITFYNPDVTPVDSAVGEEVPNQKSKTPPQK